MPILWFTHKGERFYSGEQIQKMKNPKLKTVEKLDILKTIIAIVTTTITIINLIKENKK